MRARREHHKTYRCNVEGYPEGRLRNREERLRNWDRESGGRVEGEWWKRRGKRREDEDEEEEKKISRLVRIRQSSGEPHDRMDAQG